MKEHNPNGSAYANSIMGTLSAKQRRDLSEKLIEEVVQFVKTKITEKPYDKFGDVFKEFLEEELSDGMSEVIRVAYERYVDDKCGSLF